MSVVGAVAGAGLDRLFGEPRARFHPVARFGSMMEAVERRTYSDRRIAGLIHLVVGVTACVAVGLGLRRLLGKHASTALATWACVAATMLDDEASSIALHLQSGDLDAARVRVRSLVGRSTEELDANQISRAVIESVAENCVDAVTASLFWATVGGAPAVLAHRAINTLDAMVGHRNERYERFGWATARVDDVVNYIPARLTTAAVIVARPTSAQSVVRTVRRDAPRHPSPNGGVVEAAFAAALAVRLGGVNTYDGHVEDRGLLGDGRAAEVADIDAAVRLRRDSTVVVIVLLVTADRLRRQAIRRRR